MKKFTGNSKYWKEFYADIHSSELDSPSDFARFCIPFMDVGSSVLDCGCGNFRDSKFFASRHHPVIAVDNSSYLCYSKFPNIDFQFKDILSLDDFSVNNVYARFFIHTISEEDQTNFLTWVSRNINDGVFCIETRSIEDKRFGVGIKVGRNEYVNEHYRRFIDKDEVLMELTDLGFTILFETERCGLAVLESEDPSIIRIIARR